MFDVWSGIVDRASTTSTTTTIAIVASAAAVSAAARRGLLGLLMLIIAVAVHPRRPLHLRHLLLSDATAKERCGVSGGRRRREEVRDSNKPTLRSDRRSST